MQLTRRDCLSLSSLTAGAIAAGSVFSPAQAQDSASSTNRQSRDLTIKGVIVTPIALPDPPILAACGCHGTYFLRASHDEHDQGHRDQEFRQDGPRRAWPGRAEV